MLPVNARTDLLISRSVFFCFYRNQQTNFAEEPISNRFRAGGTLASGSVESFNNKVKLVTKKSYDFKTQKAYGIALYHNLGDLTQLEFTHIFF